MDLVNRGRRRRRHCKREQSPYITERTIIALVSGGGSIKKKEEESIIPFPDRLEYVSVVFILIKRTQERNSKPTWISMTKMHDVVMTVPNSQRLTDVSS